MNMATQTEADRIYFKKSFHAMTAARRPMNDRSRTRRGTWEISTTCEASRTFSYPVRRVRAISCSVYTVAVFTGVGEDPPIPKKPISSNVRPSPCRLHPFSSRNSLTSILSQLPWTARMRFEYYSRQAMTSAASARDLVWVISPDITIQSAALISGAAASMGFVAPWMSLIAKSFLRFLNYCIICYMLIIIFASEGMSLMFSP
jgi:hypothetical protein